MKTMKAVLLRTFVISVVLATAGAAAVPQANGKDDPLVRTYALDQASMYGVMGRAVGTNWKVTHSDKDLCLVTFEAPTKLTSSGFEATATCEPNDKGGSRVRVKARQKGHVSMKGKEAGFAKKVFEAIEKGLQPKNQ
jgi:hypothetical protein